MLWFILAILGFLGLWRFGSSSNSSIERDLDSFHSHRNDCDIDRAMYDPSCPLYWSLHDTDSFSSFWDNHSTDIL
ncbi:hypothetical protein [Hydrogenobacter hydrogenophilus]|uniref:Uncharacterized protein n=1 Tax=Hydrogenobacter hydrogenophilus TaxID=35835 RepID=A0A285NW59_9AQUI|nr:hypothetical protein [Hydrogenobacter hydrogenophilus]SNZ11871.1 hypothetical protein SAMN06265353_0349 [Hydrogenobacter hydrogenophilus]